MVCPQIVDIPSPMFAISQACSNSRLTGIYLLTGLNTLCEPLRAPSLP